MILICMRPVIAAHFTGSLGFLFISFYLELVFDEYNDNYINATQLVNNYF